MLSFRVLADARRAACSSAAGAASTLALAAAGLAAIGWALLDPRFRNAEGFLGSAACVPLAVGCALVAAACAGAGPLRPAVAWFAAGVIGQAVALQLVEAGRPVRYQHYQPLASMLRDHPIWLALLAAQAVAVTLGLWARWAAARAWVGRHLRPWQLVIVAAVFVLTSATVSPRIGRYLSELGFAALVQAVNLGNVVLAVWAIPPTTREAIARRFQRLLERDRGGIDPVTALAAIWVGVVAAMLSWVVYERHPHLQDEVGYLYHARYFARGLLSLPAPPVPAAFEVYVMQADGHRWFSPVPPRWPAVLALGVPFGATWLVNPVLGAVNVLLSSILLRELYDRSTARAVVLLLAVSPWHVFMAMNFMTHTVTLTCALVAAVAVVRARHAGPGTSAFWGGLAGVSLGLGVLVRPLDGVVIAALVGIWALGVGARRVSWPGLAAIALASVLVGGLTLPYNRHLTGDARIFPINAYFDLRFGKNSNAYGFGPDRGMGWAIDPFPGHSPLDAIINANLNAFSLNVELLGWSTGSLLLIALLPFLGRLTRADYAMVTVSAAVFVAYFFYYFSGGPDFGARYWYLMLLPALALTVRGVQALDAVLGSPRGQGVVGAASLGVVCLSLIALIDFFPWRAIDKYHHYLGMRPDIRELVRAGQFGADLVLIRGPEHPDYASALIYNPIDLQAAAPVFVWDRSPEVRARILASYAGRRAWIVDGPSITGRGFQVVRGPIPARDLLAETEQTPGAAPR